MGERNKLSHMIDIQSWEMLQESISEATGMAIVTVDYRGIPVTSHSGCSEFCKRVRDDEKLGGYCQKCDARGSLEGVIAQKPFIYRCHFSIIDIAIPIIVEGNYLGAVMAGQVHLEQGDYKLNPEQIFSINDAQHIIIKKELQEYYDQIPRFTGEQLEHMVTMVYHLCDSLSKVFLKKEKVNIDEKKLCIDEKKVDVSNVSNRIVAEAVEYIYSTKNHALSLTEVAHHCHVSPPYLSRLFSKEMGESYSTFVTRLKISCAKEILQKTDMLVMEISDMLGFSEPGYFIKIFKKYTKETPMSYRANRKRQELNWNIRNTG